MNLFDELTPPIFCGNDLDSLALKLLLKYDTLNPGHLDHSELAYLSQHGYGLGTRLLDHDTLVAEAITIATNCTKEGLAQAFVAGLGQARFDWVAGLAAFAVLRQMPGHSFVSRAVDSISCEICGSRKQSNIDLTFLNQCRFATGGLVGSNIYHLWFYISVAFRLPTLIPTDLDISLFRNLLTLARNAEPTTTCRDLQKQMRKILPYKTTEEQRRTVLEILGCCGLLETAKHKGFLNSYTNLAVAPRKSRNSDWAYPIDWWTGSDGLNELALAYWFGGIL